MQSYGDDWWSDEDEWCVEYKKLGKEFNYSYFEFQFWMCVVSSRLNFTKISANMSISSSEILPGYIKIYVNRVYKFNCNWFKTIML